MELQVIEQTDNLTHVSLAGELDIDGVNAVENQFYFNLTTRKKPAIVDIAGVEFISSLGVGMLVRVAQSLRTQGVRMVLLNAHPNVAEVLRYANIDKVIPMATSREEALEKLL